MVKSFRLALAFILAFLPAVAFGQAQIGAGHVWGNSKAAQATPTDATVTAILDRALGSTRGAIIERGAAGWAIVGPGTLGQPWVSGGAGADPAYAVLGIAGGGTNCSAASGTCLDNITGFSSTGLLNRTGAGTYAFVGLPLAVSNGGTNCAAASGTCLDNITGFSSTGYMRRTGAGTYAFSLAATAAQYLAGTATNVPIEPSIIYQAEVAITFSATPTFDMSTFINARITLTANITGITLSNVSAGKAGHIVFKQSGAGSFTAAGWDSKFKFPGATAPTLTIGSTTAEDVLFYDCTSTTVCYAQMGKDFR